MLNLFNWDKDAWQVALEGVSFYFISKIPVAFREKARVFIPDEKPSFKVEKFISDIKLTAGEIQYVPKKDFKSMMEKAYRKAIMRGAQRIAQERLISEEKMKSKRQIEYG
jgi:hypothetical protein